MSTTIFGIPFNPLRSRVKDLEAQLKEARDLVSACVIELDKTQWQTLALYRILIESGATSARGVSEILGIENEEQFIEWVGSKNEAMSDEAKKLFGEITQFKKTE